VPALIHLANIKQLLTPGQGQLFCWKDQSERADFRFCWWQDFFHDSDPKSDLYLRKHGIETHKIPLSLVVEGLLGGRSLLPLVEIWALRFYQSTISRNIDLRFYRHFHWEKIAL
jgi:hypothetical protein